VTWLDLFLKNWSAIAGIIALLGALAVLLLSTKFPKRREFEKQTAQLNQRLDAMGARMDAHDLHVREVGGHLGVISERLKSLDEKMGWRFGALENQVTILLRGHLEWEDR